MKANLLKNPFNIAKHQEFELITSSHFKNLISPKPSWNSKYFRFKKKRRFLKKSSKPGHENLALITSTIQTELSKLNFNFDDIRTNFVQVLTYYSFSRFLCYDDTSQN